MLYTDKKLVYKKKKKKNHLLNASKNPQVIITKDQQVTMSLSLFFSSFVQI